MPTRFWGDLGPDHTSTDGGISSLEVTGERQIGALKW